LSPVHAAEILTSEEQPTVSDEYMTIFSIASWAESFADYLALMNATKLEAYEYIISKVHKNARQQD